MSKNCTCGAPLPEDARFCHRCGKPQWEEDIAAVEPPPVPPAIAAAARNAGVTDDSLSFNNPLALRTSLLVASITTIIEIIPFVGFIAPILGGFASVSLYQRRSGQALTTRAAAKLGWITAIINAVLFTMWMTLNLALQGTAIFDAVRDNLRHQVTTPAQQEALKMLSDPWVLGLTVVLAWIVFFVFSSLLYMAGGALGAKFAKQRAS